MSGLNSKELAWAQELRDEGMTIASIADKMEVSSAYIARNTRPTKNKVSATKLRELAESDCLPDYELIVTVNRKIVGTFTPAKSAH